MYDDTSIPDGIIIVAVADGDDTCGASWWEARNARTGELLCESDEVFGVSTSDDGIGPVQNSPRMLELRRQLERDISFANVVVKLLVRELAYRYWRIKIFLYQIFADENALVHQENEMVQAAKRWRW